MVGHLSPTSRFGTVIPLSVIAFISGLKELSEDRKRHMQDNIVNNRIVKVFRGSSFQDCLWKDIMVGDVVKVEDLAHFPADLVVISSSEPDGLCYIETSNLDGETNLKIKQSIPETANCITPDSIARFDAKLETELPNNSLYTFSATLNLSGHCYPIGPNQLLLRGAQLRNTKWVYAIVVFTGHETKLMKNATPTPIKKTKVENMVNSEIIFLLFVLLIMAITCATGQMIAENSSLFNHHFLLSSKITPLEFTGNILTFVILFNNFIPLSMVVTVEIVRIALAQFINLDLDMYHDQSQIGAVAKTSTLVEELGQVDFLFSDKTGTLTQNIMTFKMASIGGVNYSETIPEGKAIAEAEGHMKYKTFSDLKENLQKGPNQAILNNFLALLSVCHTVIPERDDANPSIVKYQASSPDEAALVEGAKQLGYFFHTRKPKYICISVDGIDIQYELLNINEFNSDRKRMSMVVRCPDKTIKLFIKGADTVMFERLSEKAQYREETEYSLAEYANEGLRTLVIASRVISEPEYEEWSKVYNAAATSIENREKKLEDAADIIEKNLELIGATAIEDKLQDEVPDTIHTLMEAGIRVWVLTGDRQETAINIAYSTKLINPRMALLICNKTTLEDTKEYLVGCLTQLKLSLKPYKKPSWLETFIRGNSGSYKFDKSYGLDTPPMALVIDGKSLGFALDPSLRFKFLELALMCEAVVCCRVSPLQKALVVRLVKRNVAGAVTMAIGDGANDVGMIQAAHVGVGISGMEGQQAARSSDFSISQFRYLKKLLLVHGSWAYDRVSKTLFETWAGVSSYNVLWTLLPPLAFGILDQCVNSKMLFRYPQLYKAGQDDLYYNHARFLGWASGALCHSVLLFFGWMLIIGEGEILGNGKVVDNWVFGIFVYTSTLFVIMIKLCLVIDSVNYVFAFTITVSVIGYLCLFPAYIVIGPMVGISTELKNALPGILSTTAFYFGTFFIPIVANLLDFTLKYIKCRYYPDPHHIIQEIQKCNIPDYRPRTRWFNQFVLKYHRASHSSYSFSQSEGQEKLIRRYDSTKRKPLG
ncbi:hypothetical protein HDV01_005369 [Terramyces sp. JEL0728]|nr:hypothetical protein HDV01_005369 [Terramyces sp. JEL0728]